MSKLKDLLYDSLHFSSNDSLQRSFIKYLQDGLKAGEKEMRSLRASSKNLASRTSLDAPKILLVAGVAGLAAAAYLCYRHKTRSERQRAMDEYEDV